PDALRHHHSGRQLPAVPDPADGGARRVAALGRRAERVEQRDAGLSGAAAGRLCLCPSAGTVPDPPAGRDPPRAAGAGRDDAAGAPGRSAAARAGV
ncbi:hypothetical protein OY671_010584, partial [Metschnikowia pulcherrima]